MFRWANPTGQMQGKFITWTNDDTATFQKLLTQNGQVCILVETKINDDDPLTSTHRAQLHEWKLRFYGLEENAMYVPVKFIDRASQKNSLRCVIFCTIPDYTKVLHNRA